MRTNGIDNEELLARLTTDASEATEEPALPESSPPGGDEAVLAEAPVRASKAPRSRTKRPASRSQAPKSVPAPESKKKAASKSSGKANRKSIAPKSRRVPASVAAVEDARSSASPGPVSRDPRTTLRDHPDQMSAAKAARAATAPRREDEISIPPTSSDPPGDLDERFFAEGEIAAKAHESDHAKRSVVLDSGAFADDPEARRVAVVPPGRRERLTNYVKGAVGFCAVLLLAGVARAGYSHVVHSSGERSAAAAQVVLAAPPVEPIPVAAPMPAPLPAEAELPAVPDEPAAPTKTAKEEKEDARASLEHGKRQDAIDAATRSVTLDPLDAEAWLILGSAQQDIGHWKEGREAYVQCTKQAKTGPVSECAMMLR